MIQIAIADDHFSVRMGITSFIAMLGGMEVTIAAENGRQLIDMLDRAGTLPHICFMDINIPVMNGFDAMAALHKRWPEIKVLAYTIGDNYMYVKRMIMEGAGGYLLKGASADEVKKAVISMYNTGIYINEIVSKDLLRMAKHGELKPIDLTPTELDLLERFCSEDTYEVIASKTGRTKKSVEGHRDALFKKLGIHSRTSLAKFAIQNGIIPFDIFGTDGGVLK